MESQTLETRLESLETYDNIANRLIDSFGQPWMHDDRYKSILITNLVKSDIDYRDDKGASLETYRFGGWKFAKMKMFQLKKREKQTISLDVNVGAEQKPLYTSVPSDECEPIEQLMAEEDVEAQNSLVNSILTHPDLTKVERIYLNLIYKDGLTHNIIADRLGVTKQAVSFTEQKALRKLRSIYANS